MAKQGENYEEEILKFWKENQIYQKLKSKNKNGKKFYFLQGPPYANGKIHIGHAWNNSMKDTIMRYKRMQGFNVWDRAGYDMHGLPVENKVQAELKLVDKEEIKKYGVEKFIKKCQEFSLKNVDAMNQDLERLGVWMDFENAYLPISNDFISAEWLLIKKAHEQKRLYKGKKIMQWCGECETSLAKHELEYETVNEKSIFLKFKIKDTKDEYLVIWTTTPWTIPFNLAVMVNPELDYVKAEIETDNGKENWIVASQLASVFISGLLGHKFKVLETFKGSELEGTEYTHPFYDTLKKQYDEIKKQSKNLHTVILSKEYVDTTAGSGLVHCAPGCGPEDYEVGSSYGLPGFNMINEKAVFEDMGSLSGMIAKKDDKKFIEKLKEVGSLITETQVEHEYAHCWRCHNPVVFRATEQWFLKTEDLIPKILSYDKKINWVPDFAKKSYESWIENLKDNGLTRQRFWGTPMPIWACDKCEKIEIIGSEEELKKKAKTKVPENLHKPWIDSVKLKCSCGSTMSRVPDVLDVWIDSGTVSWSCLYYPEREDYFKEFFPADMILEATEQTRLWFSMLQMASAIMFNKPAYKNVYAHGMILDYQGMKMSKSLGNIISPYEVVDKYNADILRYYICQTTAGKNINFNWEDIKQKQRNLIVLQNISRYLQDLKLETEKGTKGPEEEFIISRKNSAVKKVTELLEEYRLDEIILEIENLFLELSRTYIKFIRDKQSKTVYETIKEVYTDTLKMFSIICPFITEKIWQELKGKGIVKEESVHLTGWPKVDSKKINSKLEQEIELAMQIIESGLRERDQAQIGLKWPLSQTEIVCNQKLSKPTQEIIANQLNVKKIKITLGKELSVKLDTKMIPELEREGFARVISRNIQAGRKKAGLTKEDSIELEISGQVAKIIEPEKEFIKQRVGAKTIKIATEKSQAKYSYSEEGKIKDKEFVISLNKL